MVLEKVFNTYEISGGLGPEKARALLVFQALTGCYTVSNFAWHGKKTAWAVLAVFPELTNAPVRATFRLP